MAYRASHDRYAVGQCHVFPPDNVDLQVISTSFITRFPSLRLALCQQGIEAEAELKHINSS